MQKKPIFNVDLVITWSGDIKAIEVCLQCYQNSLILDLLKDISSYCFTWNKLFVYRYNYRNVHDVCCLAFFYIPASKARRSDQFSGKITVKAKEKSYSKLEIPYQAEVLEG